MEELASEQDRLLVAGCWLSEQFVPHLVELREARALTVCSVCSRALRVNSMLSRALKVYSMTVSAGKCRLGSCNGCTMFCVSTAGRVLV